MDVHWHGYVEEVPLGKAKKAAERRESAPHEVMTTPQEVAAWVESTVKAAASSLEDTDFKDSLQVWTSLASHAESITTGVADEITVTADALTAQECDCLSRKPSSVSRLSKSRRRSG